MPTTLGEAIEDVRGYLDDRQGRRWTDAQVTRALHSALSQCVSEYGSRGGDAFDEEINVTTVASVGVSLAVYDPLLIRAVILSMNVGGPWTSPIRRCTIDTRGIPDETARDLLIRIVRRPTLPQETTDMLVGVDVGAARPWPAFERWVCTCAALELRTTDNEPMETLMDVNQRLEEKCLSIARTPQTLPWPRKRRATNYDELQWIYQPRTALLSLHSVLGW